MQPSPARFLVACLSLIVLLAGAGSASAAITITDVTATPSTTQAGGHPNLTVTTSFSGENTQIGGPGPANPVADSPSLYAVHLGPGLFANPLAAPTCTLADFEADACAPTTIVGSATQSIFILATSGTATLPGIIYNLETTDPDQATLLGVRTLTTNPAPPPPAITASRIPFAVTISPADLGLDSINLEPLTAVSAVAGPIRITQLSLTLNGSAINGFYMSNPTACVPVEISVSAVSNAGGTAAAETSFTPTGCGALPFDVGLDLGLSSTRTDTPVETAVTLTLPGSDDPLRQSAVLESTVVLPLGMTVNPALAEGLEACTDAQFAAGDRTTAAACPAASRIGTVRFVSPLFTQTFEGPVYYGTRTPTAFNRLFVDVPIPGVHLKLVGRVTLNAANGQVTTVFEDLPQLPFTSFQLTFQGGPRAVLVTPQSCGPHTATADLVPYARLTDPTPPNARPTETFTTSFDGAGAACAVDFRPFFFTSLSNPLAGAHGSAFTLEMTRPDRHARIDRVAFKLRAGLVGDLTLAGLTQCALDVAARGDCPASSRVGSVSVEVGSGPAPARLPGEVFLTRPREDGDPAGLSILVPARLGPVDLGTIEVGVRLQLRSNGGLNATSERLPQLLEGVPVGLRSALITLDRRGFMRNPTSCGRGRSRGTFTSVDGRTWTAFAALTVEGCERLAFEPRIRARLGARGRMGEGAHPSFVTTIRARGDDAAIRRAYVRLPKALSTNVRALNAACEPEELDAGTCSRRALIARARAVSPLLEGAVTGPVWLVKREGGGLPKLVVQLRDPVALTFEGVIKVGPDNRIVTVFSRLPDLSLTRFTLRFHGGRFGIVAATENLCRRTLHMPTRFKGQNGKKVVQRPRIAVRGCRR
jgi:hypothetical protein